MIDLEHIAHHPEAQVVTRFTHEGRECVVLNMRDRHYCGYVKTPFDGKTSEFKEVFDVHGDLSYGPDSDGWIGFDTHHGFDIPTTEDGRVLANNPIAAIFGAVPRDEPETKEWSPSDVVDETIRLAEQVAEMVPDGELGIEEVDEL